jgi:hypothetical protein
MHMFFKKNLIVALHLHHPFVTVESIALTFIIFRPNDASPPFPLPGAASPLADVTTPPRRVTLLSHGAKMSSLPPLHLPAMLRPFASPLEPKLKH